MHTDDDERAMMLNPSRWPLFPLLALKRYREHSLPDTAVLAAISVFTGTHTTTEVWFAEGNVYDPPKAEQFVRRDVAAVLAEGWRVD